MAIAEHAWAEQHRLEWDNITILDRASKITTLSIKKELHISLAGQYTVTLLNRDQGTAVADCWKPLLRRNYD